MRMGIIAQRLEIAMEWRDLDQQGLAEKVGITQGAVSKIVQGKTANSRWLPKIATELGVALPWLLGKTDDPASSGAPALSVEDEDWLSLIRALEPADKKAILQIARTMAYSARAPALNDKGIDFRPPRRR